MATEVLHGDIRLTLSDADAIRGMRRTEAAVERGLGRISRKKGEVYIEGNIKDFKRALKEAEEAAGKSGEKLKKLLEQREGLVGAKKGAITKRINAETRVYEQIQNQISSQRTSIALAQKHLDMTKRTNKEAELGTKQQELHEKAQDATAQAAERELRARQDLGRMQSAALKMDRQRTKILQDHAQAEGKMHAAAMEADRRRSESLQKNAQLEGKTQAAALAMDEKRTAQISKQERVQGELELQARRAFDAEMTRRGQAYMRAESDMRSLGDLQIAARREFERDMARRADLQQRAIDDEKAHLMIVGKLQKEYNDANQALQKLQQTGSVRRAISPRQKLEFEINERRLYGQMQEARHKLEMMNEEAIDVRVNVRQGKALEALAGVGDIGLRVGPFTGTLKGFTKAAVALGPILIGLMGTVTALGGAIGVGLTGGLGLAATGLAAFGAIGVGVFAALKPLGNQISYISKASDAYAKAVREKGEDSEKAATKLKELNSVMGHVSENAREGFKMMGQVGDRWVNLTKASRNAGLNVVGETVRALNYGLPMLSRNINNATKALGGGVTDWVRGMSSASGQGIINTILGNTSAAITPMMAALGQLGAAFGRLTASFSRHFVPLMNEFRDWTTGLNEAAQNTGRLDRGVDSLVSSFRSVLGVATAFGRVIREVAQAAAGPGGSLMDDMANGLNRLAENIDRNPTGLRDFFAASINTTRHFFDLLKPIVALFFEFSTILRPMTDALLQVAGAFAQLVASVADFGPMRALIQVGLTAWFLRRTTAATIGIIAGAFNGLAAAATRAGVAMGSASLMGAGGALGRLGRRAGGSAPPIAVPGAAGRASAAARVGAVPAATSVAPVGGAVGVGAMSRVGAGLGALSMGLLGVSAPIAALGLAAVGAAVGVSKLRDRAQDQAAEENTARRVLGPNAIPRRGQVDYRTWEKERDAAVAASKAILNVNNALRQSGLIQRELVNVASNRNNAMLMTQQAEKSYAAAVKASGKNSLEARVALQQLQDARRMEKQATEAWGNTQRQALQWVERGVEAARQAWLKSKGTGAEEAMARRLERARDSAAAFTINVARAKRGLDAFTGEGAEAVGRLVRKFGDIPGFKRVVIQAEDAEAARKIGEMVGKLDGIGRTKAVAKILADSKNPEEALRRLERLFEKYRNTNPETKLKANLKEARENLREINAKLDKYGGRQPEALLKAKDKATKEVEKAESALNRLNGKNATVKVDVKFAVPSNFTTDRFGGRGPEGDGWGAKAPDIVGGVKKFAQNNSAKLSEMFMGSGGLGNAGATGSGLNAFNGWAKRFGVDVGSGFRPGSITSSGNLSYHAMGRARDFPGPAANMMRFAKFMASMFGARLKELIYTPLGFSIKDGKRVPPYAQAQHYDHVHVAMAHGGKVGGEPRSGRYTQPTVLFAEEPKRPEYFISTNPRDRKRSRKLIHQAAAEVGLLEHTPMFHAQEFARSGKRGKKSTPRGLGNFKFAGSSLSGEQQKIFQTAVAMARAYGAPAQATKALLAALWAESEAKNLTYGHSTSTGPLQLLTSTARGLGVNPRDTKAVIKLFLKTGFTGKGGAIALANKKGLSAAEIATMVQGNRDGASTYSPFVDDAANLLKAVGGNGPGGGGSAGGGDSESIREKAVSGAFVGIETRLARAQSRVDAAGLTTGNFADDVNAILGRTRKVRLSRGERRGLRRQIRRISRSDELHPSAGVRLDNLRGQLRRGTKSVRTPGLVGETQADSRVARQRLRKVSRALRGKLGPTKRAELLAEQAQLTQTLSGNRTKIAELRTQAGEAKFERDRGRGNRRIDIDRQAAMAASTEGVEDDLAAARADQNYWTAREQWAKRRGDRAAATEARNNINSAADQIRSIQDDIRSKQLAYQENLQQFMENEASLTGTLNDDLEQINNGLALWQGRLNEALGRGDADAALAARGNISQYIERQRDLREDMTRLPLERNRALAELTDQTDDDKAATVALRDYWQGRLNAAKREGDIQGQIDAAGNLKSLNDEIKQAEGSIQQQMILLSDARRDLYRSFGSNFVPSIPATAARAAAAAPTFQSGTVDNRKTVIQHINMEQPPDSLTWSANVAWDLQALV